MAENESLDLGSPYAKRWEVVCLHICKGASAEQVALKIEDALYKSLRNALKQCKEKGVTLADLLNSRDCPQDLRKLLRATEGHDFVRLFADAAAVYGPTDTECLAGWIDAFLDKVTDQICHRVAESEHHPTIDGVQAFMGKVREILNPVVKRIVKKLVKDPDWLPQRARKKGRAPRNDTEELMNMSLLGAPSHEDPALSVRPVLLDRRPGRDHDAAGGGTFPLRPRRRE